MRRTTSAASAVSVRSAFRNFRRAGVAKNRSFTSISVPRERAAGRGGVSVPPSTEITCAIVATARARCNRQPADRPDRGQGLAAEPEEADIHQIVVGELRCGMALDRQCQILGAHADPVIGHADEGLATASEGDVDLGGAGVDGVLDKLLHHAGGRSMTSPAAMRFTVPSESLRIRMAQQDIGPAASSGATSTLRVSPQPSRSDLSGWSRRLACAFT